MVSVIQQPAKMPHSDSPPSVPCYTGEVGYIYGFDVAHEMSRQPVRELLGQPVAPFGVDAGKRSPKQLFCYKPQMVRLPAQECIGSHGPVRVERAIKLLPAAPSASRYACRSRSITSKTFIAFHDLQFSNGSLHEEVRRLAEEVVAELKSHYVRPHPQLVEEEAHTVFCIESPLINPEGVAVTAESWFQSHRRKVAALLTQEPDMGRLSKQESDESTARYLSYYENDLVVIDWDAALIIDEPHDFDETLHIMELVNLQLAELEAYDRILDSALERSYRDLGERPLRSRGDILRELRELRIDLARFNDELSNITKFFRDWQLARIYKKISSRFHLGDWHRTIDGKLKTLDDLLLKHDQTNRWRSSKPPSCCCS